uniref:HTH psq-type domain-containing protein n=1 Tax=Romanomermis culicivorax TaxID=13658 RepID=A0A915JXH1_ROMCU
MQPFASRSEFQRAKTKMFVNDCGSRCCDILKKIRSRAYKNYTVETLQKALDVCCAGMSFRDSSELYKVSKSTLQHQLVGKNLNLPGRPMV